MSIRALAAIAILLATCVSCIGFHGPEGVRRDLVQATGAELDREISLSIGPMGMMIVRWFTDEDEVPLKGVRRMKVGVYAVNDRGAGGAGQDLLDLPAFSEWEPVVQIREEDETVFVMTREKKETIRGMLVVVMEPDEWVLVRLDGRLQHTMEQVMQMAFEEADRPELYEPAVTEYRSSRSSS